jgi:hypothetical protein
MSDRLSLYEINETMAQAVARAEASSEETGGEIDAATAAELDALDMDRKDKIGNLARYVKNLRASADAVSAEAKRLREREATTMAKADRLEAYLADMIPGEKYEDGAVRVSWRRSERIVVDCTVDSLPAKLVRVIPEKREPDKEAIKLAFKRGVRIPGVSVVSVNNIQVK